MAEGAAERVARTQAAHNLDWVRGEPLSDLRRCDHDTVAAQLHNRCVETAFEQSIGRLVHKLRTMGEREVPSRLVGELVMEELRSLDEVAYVRFASVYRRFQDVTEFEEEIKRLQRISEAAASREQMSLLPDLLGKKNR